MPTRFLGIKQCLKVGVAILFVWQAETVFQKCLATKEMCSNMLVGIIISIHLVYVIAKQN